jgi:hypothetical protein
LQAPGKFSNNGSTPASACSITKGKFPAISSTPSTSGTTGVPSGCQFSTSSGDASTCKTQSAQNASSFSFKQPVDVDSVTLK